MSGSRNSRADVQAGTLDLMGRVGRPRHDPRCVSHHDSLGGRRDLDWLRPHVCRRSAGREPRICHERAMGSGAGRNVGLASAAAGDRRVHRLFEPALSSRRDADRTCGRRVPRLSRRLARARSPICRTIRLVDKAIGVDTSGRVQTAWQVKLMPVPQGATWTCSTPDSTIFPAPSAGRLDTNVAPNATAGPCCLTTGSGYTGVENRALPRGDPQSRIAGRPGQSEGRDIQMVARERLRRDARHQHRSGDKFAECAGLPAYGHEPRPRSRAGLHAGQLDRARR